MARRGFGGTALRAALGAVTGVAEGLQQRDLLAAQKQREDEAMALNQFNALRAAGFEFGTPRTAPDLAARNVTALETPALPAMTPQAGGSMLGRAIQTGLGVTAGAPSMAAPRFGTAAELPALDTSKIRQFERGVAMQPATPAERIKLGGMELTVRSPKTDEEKFADQMRQYEQQLNAQQQIKGAAEERAAAKSAAADEAKVKTLVLAGVPEEQAKAGVMMGAKFGELLETPESRRRAEMDLRNLSLKERQYALDVARYNLSEQANSQKIAEAQDKKKAAVEALSNVLPTIIGAQKTLNSWGAPELKKLSAEGVNAAMVANMASTTPQGIAASWMLNKTLVKPLDREYAQYARSVADAVARASEVGVLTNQDIARYQNQVTFVAGDDEATKSRKFEALKTWASWLANNKKNLVDGNRRAIPAIPGETPTEALARLRGGQ